MRYRPFGRTGLHVSELCLRTMTFGGKGLDGREAEPRPETGARIGKEGSPKRHAIVMGARER